ncbi:MAG: serine/threonine protein kinase [Verrucomicrobiales bacterium]|jgi:serine/threonine protein kinase
MSSGSGYSASRPGEFDAPSAEELSANLPNYEIEKLIAKGGMGAVYLGKQIMLNRICAIKLLPHIEDDGGMRMIERFEREAQAMAKLKHANLIEVYEIGETTDGMHYFAMEHVDGHDMHTLLHTGKLTTEHVFSWIPQICGALQYAHSQGLIHRDVKPANILVNKEGIVKMIDFGLARPSDPKKLVARLTMTNVALGTPDYAAPEARQTGVDADYRGDLYAIGVILYQMLTGRLPRGAWRPPSALVPGMDPRFDPIVVKAMSPDPEGRYQQAQDIAADIHAIRKTPQFQRAGSSSPSSPSPGQRKTVKRAKRSSGSKSSGNLASFFVAGGIALGLILIVVLILMANG